MRCQLELALYAGKLSAYAQGFAVMEAASREFSWNLPMATIARIWRAGCIIRSQFLGAIASAFPESGRLSNLLVAPEFVARMKESVPSLRKTIDKPGVYGFKCKPHYGMGMVGLIVVGEPVNKTAAAACAGTFDFMPHIGRHDGLWYALGQRACSDRDVHRPERRLGLGEVLARLGPQAVDGIARQDVGRAPVGQARDHKPPLGLTGY